MILAFNHKLSVIVKQQSPDCQKEKIIYFYLRDSKICYICNALNDPIIRFKIPYKRLIYN